MFDMEREVVPGLTVTDVRKIADQVLSNKDINHPQSNKPENGFLNILQNGKPDVSASNVFVRKVSL